MKVIRVCFDVALPRYSIGLKKKSRHFLIELEVKPKPVATRSHVFPRFVLVTYLLGVLIGLLDCPRPL